MTKSRTLYFFGVILFSLSFSYTALAHSGVEHSVSMHSILHMFINITGGLAIMAAGFLLLNCVPKGIKKMIKQKVTK